MKEKLLIIFCSLLCLVVASCDDDTEITPVNPLIREWVDSNPFEGEGLIQSLLYSFNI